MKKIITSLAVTLTMLGTIFLAQTTLTPSVLAATDPAPATQAQTGGTPPPLPLDNCKTGSTTCTLPNPLGEVNDPRVLIGTILRGLFGLLGSVALILFIYAGFNMMISAGDQGKIKKARETMVWAAIGLAVILGSYSIANFVINALVGAATQK